MFDTYANHLNKLFFIDFCIQNNQEGSLEEFFDLTKNEALNLYVCEYDELILED